MVFDDRCLSGNGSADGCAFPGTYRSGKEIVYHGPAEKKHIFYKAKKTNQAGELDFTYFNAVYTVENALAKVKMKRA